MKRITGLILFLIALTVFVLNAYAESEQKAIASSVLRFHVVAQSNSEKDQEIKLKVRDAVLKETSHLFKDVKSKKEALGIAEENKGIILEVAEKTLREEGCNRPVTVSIGKEAFPLKYYENIRLPSGEYDSVSIKIGDAKGKNWWCVMYPVLCFSESTSGKLDSKGEERMKTELGEERFRLISDKEDTKIRIKFKILELF